MSDVVFKRFPPLDYARDEAFNELCTNITFAGADKKKILFTSTHAAEGKSFSVMNTARSMTKFGKTVVIVDADLRRSRIMSDFKPRFQVEGKPMGLAHYLAGMTDAESILYQTDVGGVWLIPVGKLMSEPMSLLNNGRFSQLVNSQAEKFDYVFIDTPPVGTVIDAATIAKYCDGILMVVRYNKVYRQELIKVKNQIEQTGCPVIGTILNQVEISGVLGRKYYAKRYYEYDAYRSTEHSDSGDYTGRRRRK